MDSLDLPMNGGGVDLKKRGRKHKSSRTTAPPAIKKQTKHDFDISAMKNALDDLIDNRDDDSDHLSDSISRKPLSRNSSHSSSEYIDPIVKKIRTKKAKVPLTRTRQPSVRAQTIAAAAAKKALDKLKALKSDKPKRKPSASVKKPPSAKPVPKKRTATVDIIKRPSHLSLTFFQETYINSFVDLFNSYRPEFVELIKENAKNEFESLDEVKLNKRLIELQDLLYFEIRDELEISLGTRKRELETMQE